MMGSQLCLNFSGYFFGLQARLFSGLFKNMKSILPLSAYRLEEKNALASLLFHPIIGLMKTTFPG